jgi:hypothetical protein
VRVRTVGVVGSRDLGGGGCFAAARLGGRRECADL